MTCHIFLGPGNPKLKTFGLTRAKILGPGCLCLSISVANEGLGWDTRPSKHIIIVVVTDPGYGDNPSYTPFLKPFSRRTAGISYGGRPPVKPLWCMIRKVALRREKFGMDSDPLHWSHRCITIGVTWWPSSSVKITNWLNLKGHHSSSSSSSSSSKSEGHHQSSRWCFQWLSTLKGWSRTRSSKMFELVAEVSPQKSHQDAFSCRSMLKLWYATCLNSSWREIPMEEWRETCKYSAPIQVTCLS